MMKRKSGQQTFLTANNYSGSGHGVSPVEPRGKLVPPAPHVLSRSTEADPARQPAFSHQHAFNPKRALERWRRSKLNDPDLCVSGPVTNGSAFPLGQPHGRPRKVIMDHPTSTLQIESLGCNIGHNEMRRRKARGYRLSKPAQND